MRKVVFVFLALMIVACATAAFAQQPAPPLGQPGVFTLRPPGMNCPAMAVAPPQSAMIARLGDTLGLSEDQKTKLTDVLKKSETDLADLRAKSDAATKALRDALFAPTFDSAKVAQLLSDAQKVEASIATSEIATWGEIRGILTADQATKLADAMSRRVGGGFGGNFGGRQGTRQGGRRGNRGGQQPPAPPADGNTPDQ